MKNYRKIAAGLLLLTAALPVAASAHPPIAAEAAAANFEQDRADILAMAGNYRVSFNMQESTRWDPTYEVLEPKRSGGMRSCASSRTPAARSACSICSSSPATTTRA